MATERQIPTHERRTRDRIAASTVTWALRDAMRHYDRVMPALARRFRIGTNDAHALNFLSEHPGAGPAELARFLKITTASTTVLIDRLHAAGHVLRVSHPVDRRRLELHLTKTTQRRIRAQLLPLVREVDDATRRLTKSERAVIVAYLARVAVAWEHFAKP